MRPEDELGRGVKIAMAVAAVSLLTWLASPASADVYYYKDAAGVYHFTNVSRPDAAPFIVEHPLTQLPNVGADRGVPDKDDYDSIINKWATKLRVERALVKAVIRAESGFNCRAVSSAGARGLMQLMPDTARRHGVINIYDPEQNIEGGVRHLRFLLDRHSNNITRVVAAYNAGSDAVDRYHGIPPIAETQDYVARVLRFRQQYLKRERTSQVARNS